jgi:hypothetical protein
MDSSNFLAGFAFYFVFLAGGMAAISAARGQFADVKPQLILYFASLTIRFAFSVGLYVGGLSTALGEDDSLGWAMGAVRVEQWTAEGLGVLDLPSVYLDSLQRQNSGYGYFVGTFQFLTNTSERLPVALLSCVAGALTVVLAYRIAYEVFTPRIAAPVGWLACLAPSLIIWSAQTVKEPIVIVLETAVAYACIKFRLRRLRIRHLAICAVCLPLLLSLRFYAGYIGAAMVVFSLAVPRFGGGAVSRPRAVLVALVMLALVFAGSLTGQREAADQKFDLEYIKRMKGGLARGSGTGVETSYDLSTSSGLGLATLVGAAHLLLAPFPWQWGMGSTRLALTVPELLVWWFLFFRGVIPGFRHALREHLNEILPLLVMLMGLGVIYSVTFGNIGLVYRQRAQLLPSLLIFAMVAFDRRAPRRAGAAFKAPVSPAQAWSYRPAMQPPGIGWNEPRP